VQNIRILLKLEPFTYPVLRGARVPWQTSFRFADRLWSSWHFRFVPRRSKHIRISLEPWSGAPEERLCGIVHRRAALLLALRGFALASGTFRLNLAMGFLDVVPPPSSPKARKRGLVAAEDHLKSQHAIEADRARHVVGGEGDGTDAFDHRPSSHQRGARSPGLGGNRSVGMTQIAALVAPPHVVDQGIRPLALHLEGSDQRILRRHR